MGSRINKKRTHIARTALIGVVLLIAIAVIWYAGHAAADKRVGREASSASMSTKDVHAGDKDAGAASARFGGDSQDIQDLTEQDPDRKSIVTGAQLTDETTGKGAISLGDGAQKVKEVLLSYDREDVRSGLKDDDLTTAHGETLLAGASYYSFESGKLLGIYSATGESLPFETSKGLALGDTVAKMKQIYGARPQYVRPSNGSAKPYYEYRFGNITLTCTPESGAGDSAKIEQISFGPR